MFKLVCHFLGMIMMVHASAFADCTKEKYTNMYNDYMSLKKEVDRQYAQNKFSINVYDKLIANFDMAYHQYLWEYYVALTTRDADAMQCDSLANLFDDLISGLRGYLFGEVTQEDDPLQSLPLEVEPKVPTPKEKEPATPPDDTPLSGETEPKSATPIEREPTVPDPKPPVLNDALPEY